MDYSVSASINPYFNRLDEWQKEAVIWDMKMNLDLRGEYSDYQIELENSRLPFPAEWDTVIPEEEWLVKEVINHKGWEGNFTGFNLDDEGQKRHFRRCSVNTGMKRPPSFWKNSFRKRRMNLYLAKEIL